MVALPDFTLPPQGSRPTHEETHFRLAADYNSRQFRACLCDDCRTRRMGGH